jgi:hypothetical protein
MTALVPGWRRLVRALEDPAQAQRALLRQTLAENQGAAYGRRYGFAQIRSVEGYQAQAPIMDADSLRPWAERIARGERAVLTEAPVEAFERSSGSTAGDKRIPYTASLRGQFSAATAPWLLDMQRRRPGLWGRRSYWSLSPAARAPEVTAGGVPVGLVDDAAYFSPLERWAIRQCWAVDPATARAPDMAAWRRATAAQLLAAPDLGFISVWSPTFLVELMQWLTRDLWALLGELPRATAASVRHRLHGRPLNGRALWPGLAVISCWCDGPSAAFLPALRRWFPGVAIEPKGLLATEGVVSVPWGDPDAGGLPAITSHFLEFIDLSAPERAPTLAHALAPGGRYAPLLTTAGGLYRYHLRDVVEALPPAPGERLCRLRFVGRADGGSDLCGEKLSPAWVAAALEAVRLEAGYPAGFLMLAPHRPPRPRAPHYTLFIDAQACAPPTQASLARLTEAALARGHHYRYARDLGQLGPVEVCAVRDPWRRYAEALCAQGMRLGDIKPKWLDSSDKWRAHMVNAAADDT